jgi:hypothetical protein
MFGDNGGENEKAGSDHDTNVTSRSSSSSPNRTQIWEEQEVKTPSREDQAADTNQHMLECKQTYLGNSKQHQEQGQLREDKFETLTKAMFAMQEKMAEMATFMSAGGVAVKQEPNMLGTGYVKVKQEQNKYEQVKDEPIDVVSSSSDADFNEYGNEADDARTRLPALKQPLPPVRAAPKAKYARSTITGVPPPPPVQRSRTKPTSR